MAYKLQKKATGADRARRRIHVPGEALAPTFTQDGLVHVSPRKAATVRTLQARGWELVPDAPPAPAAPEPAPAPAPAPAEAPPSREAELVAMTVRELRAMARELGIKGRSSMNEAELVAAIIAAEAA